MKIRLVLLSYCIVLFSLSSSARDLSDTVYYTLSEGMPLSKLGLPNIQKVAKERNYNLVLLNDPFSPVENIRPSPKPLVFSPESIYNGMFLHFPSVLLVRKGKTCGTAVAGYKTVEGYHTTFNLLESNCDFLHQQMLRSAPQPLEQINSEIVRRDNVSGKQPGYYFRTVTNDWLEVQTSVEKGPSGSFFLNRDSSKIYFIDGATDAVPTPDSRFMTFPGLTFLDIRKFLIDPESAPITKIFEDAEFNDQYQSIGILKETPSRLVYRVLTAWSETVKVRDYEYDLKTDKIRTVSDVKKPCPQIKTSTPMMSNDGLFFTATDNTVATTKLYSLGEGGNQCDVVYDLGIKTGKALFERGRTGRFSTVSNVNGVPNVFVGDYKTKKLASVYTSSDHFLAYPQFYPNGNIAVLSKDKIKTEILELDF